MKSFLQKNAKFLQKKTSPPNPQPPAAGGSAPRPLEQPPSPPPHCEFLATRLLLSSTIRESAQLYKFKTYAFFYVLYKWTLTDDLI